MGGAQHTEAPSAREALPRPGRALLRNRSFTLLWSGDVLSELGSQATTVAMPLLVLSLTGSPAKAGLVSLGRMLAYPLAPLPAGVLADRMSRRRLMVMCALGRALAMGSVVAALALGRPPLWQLALVAFADAALWSASTIAERGLLAHVVAPHELADAVALNEARASLAVIGGPPIGGALFQAARALPFVADAGSFVFASLAVIGIRAPAPVPRPRETSRGRALAAMAAEVREGAVWLWRQPFLRAGSLLYAAANLTLGSAQLLAILVARHHHASSAAIGVAFALIGGGGVLGAVLAGPARRRLTPRLAVLAEPWFYALLIPLLLLCHSALAVGLVLGAAFIPIPLSSSVVVGRRLALTPDELRGRVQASSAFLSGAIAWIGPPVVGFLFQDAGETVAVLAVAGWALAVALGATASRALRRAPAETP
ncbi:MAG TPA: MFS transporter [Solirubrobacteraceae bacterium]|nr:MFS transporter [Solirubrobacteraceae bacterium]